MVCEIGSITTFNGIVQVFKLLMLVETVPFTIHVVVTGKFSLGCSYSYANSTTMWE